MRISWVIAGSLSLREGRIYSPQASLRYRCLIPAEILSACGHQVEFIRTDTLTGAGAVGDADFGDVVVFAKSFHQINEALAERARGLGRRIVVDHCDLDFRAKEPLREHRGRMLALADQTVAASGYLAEQIAAEFGVSMPDVISDPYELPYGAPRFAPPAGVARILWYGHTANIADLMETIDALATLGGDPTIGRRLEVTAIAGPIDGIADAFAAANRKFAGRLRLDFVEWSLDAVTDGLAATDIVILPTAINDEKRSKSANRVVEGLRAGRFVAASPVPAYAPFADAIRLDTDLAAGLRWTFEHSREIAARIQAGQAYIEGHHSPHAISDQWEAVLTA